MRWLGKDWKTLVIKTSRIRSISAVINQGYFHSLGCSHWLKVGLTSTKSSKNGLLSLSRRLGKHEVLKEREESMSWGGMRKREEPRGGGHMVHWLLGSPEVAHSDLGVWSGQQNHMGISSHVGDTKPPEGFPRL